MAFENFDLTDFWLDSAEEQNSYRGDEITDELIAALEQELGYRLPESYIGLMRRHNGGVPRCSCHAAPCATSWAADHVAISGILGLGRTNDNTLGGRFGSRFMVEEWEYPDIGVAICDCPSAGHDMIFLDYRACGPKGEPAVVHVDQEWDYAVTPLAADFESFIRGLVSEESYGEPEEPATASPKKTGLGRLLGLLGL